MTWEGTPVAARGSFARAHPAVFIQLRRAQTSAVAVCVVDPEGEATMNSIERFFLRAKHWQIFLLIVGVCFIGQMTVVTSMATQLRSADDFDGTARMRGIMTVVFMLFFLGWFWSMGSFLTSIIAEPQRLPYATFGWRSSTSRSTSRSFSPRLAPRNPLPR